MINRDDLTPDERDVYDRSFVGSVERLDRELVNLKQAIRDALPPFMRRFFDWWMGKG